MGHGNLNKCQKRRSGQIFGCCGNCGNSGSWVRVWRSPSCRAHRLPSRAPRLWARIRGILLDLGWHWDNRSYTLEPLLREEAIGKENSERETEQLAGTFGSLVFWFRAFFWNFSSDDFSGPCICLDDLQTARLQRAQCLHPYPNFRLDLWWGLGNSLRLWRLGLRSQPTVLRR